MAAIPELATLLCVVLEDMRLATEVLPVVSVLAFFTVVISAIVVKRAPNCLEMEHIEVYVFLHQMENVDA